MMTVQWNALFERVFQQWPPLLVEDQRRQQLHLIDLGLALNDIFRVIT